MNHQMTYQIEIEEPKTIEFLQIIQSLQRLGVVRSVRKTASLALPGEPASELDLENLVQESTRQIAEGQSFSGEEMRQLLKTWRLPSQ